MRDLTFPAFLVLPVIPDSMRVNMLYHTDWYDGPLEGLLSYMGNFYWYALIWEDWEPTITPDQHSTRYRMFVLFEPTKEQLDFHNSWHAKFEHHEAAGTLGEFYEARKLVKEPPFVYSQAKYFMME